MHLQIPYPHTAGDRVLINVPKGVGTTPSGTGMHAPLLPAEVSPMSTPLVAMCHRSSAALAVALNSPGLTALALRRA